ncbi:MAG: class I SAM-dependent methyltransferase [Chitinophagales bacterium]
MKQPPTWKWKLAQTLEYKWWQRYLQHKNADEYLRWKEAYWQKLLQTISKYVSAPEGKDILDAGCGPAGIFIALKGNRVDAIDPLLDKYQQLPHFQPQRFFWTDFKNIPIESLDEPEKYDVIFCMNAINHVNDVALCYANLVKALKPGGIIVISTDAHKYSFLKKIFQALPGDMLHPVQLDIQEYDKLLTDRKIAILENIRYKSELIFDYYITIGKKNRDA